MSRAPASERLGVFARVWGENNKRAEAHFLLSPVYDWFTEGFDTPDLRDARALLDELACTELLCPPRVQERIDRRR